MRGKADAKARETANGQRHGRKDGKVSAVALPSLNLAAFTCQKLLVLGSVARLFVFNN